MNSKQLTKKHNNNSVQTIKELLIIQLFAGIFLAICMFQYNKTTPTAATLKIIEAKLTDSSGIHNLENQLSSLCKKLELIN